MVYNDFGKEIKLWLLFVKVQEVHTVVLWTSWREHLRRYRHRLTDY